MGLDDYLSFVEPADLPATDLSALLAGFTDQATVEYRVRTSTGEARWMQCKRRLIRDDRGRPSRIIGVATDVTEQKALQTRYRHQATTDELTGLANRRHLERTAREWMFEAHRSGRVSLILLDLDRFKPVNDEYGHAAGDAVLREVAARLAAQLRDQDIVARIGGDEFAILLQDVSPDALVALSSTLAKSLTKPFLVGGNVIRVGVSVGSASSQLCDRSVDDIALRADTALYVMKRSRGGRRSAPASDSHVERVSEPHVFGQWNLPPAVTPTTAPPAPPSALA